MVEDRRYGNVLSASFRRLSPKPTWGWQQWLGDPAKSGTASLDLHIHDVDFVRSLFGQPDSLKSDTVYRNGADAHITSLYKYGDIAISLEGGWDFPQSFPFEMSFRVRFERAAVTYSSAAVPTMVVHGDDGGTETVALEESAGTSGDSDGAGGGNIASLGGYYNELRYFVERLLGNEPIEQATLSDGVASLRPTLREIAAART